MFKVIKLKTLIVSISVLLLVALLGVSVVSAVSMDVSPKSAYTIVIDAGHGGRDGGVVGARGTVEKEINLLYAQTLRSLLENVGVKVIMTRTGDDALYDESSSNKKRSDMAKRCEIIRQSHPDAVISIHMNAFPNRNAKGANCFYAKGNSAGKMLGDYIQTFFSKNLSAQNTTSKVGDYYILNCNDYPSVLVECGFLSNAEEELLLNTDSYREKLCYQIYCGIAMFLGLPKNNI